MINNLKKGDRIVTGGGIYGRITAVDETTLTVEIADKVRVKISRASVAALVQKGQQEKEELVQKTQEKEESK
jgi:preprotein translocase subunit YajC